MSDSPTEKKELTAEDVVKIVEGTKKESILRKETLLDKTSKNTKNSLYLLGLLVALIGAIFAGTNEFMDKMSAIDNTATQLQGVADTFKSELISLKLSDEEINARLTNLEKYTSGEVERKILKEYEKLQKGNGGDITRVNLESIFQDYKLIGNPSDLVEMAYAALKEFYKTIK